MPCLRALIARIKKAIHNRFCGPKYQLRGPPRVPGVNFDHEIVYPEYASEYYPQELYDDDDLVFMEVEGPAANAFLPDKLVIAVHTETIPRIMATEGIRLTGIEHLPGKLFPSSFDNPLD